MELKKEEFTRSFLEFWRSRGFQILNSPSIIPKMWTTSLFIGSGLVSSLETKKEREPLGNNLTMCQPCIKHGTSRLSLMDMMNRDGYLTFFEQLNCLSVGSSSTLIFIKNIWNFIHDVAKLEKKHLYIGVSETQPKIASLWIEAGIHPNNIIFPDYEAYELALPKEALHGVYSPIYYDRADLADYPCQSERCGINCSCDRFLQIGDLGLLSFHDQIVHDHGIGLERILSVCNNLPKVSGIAEFQEIKTVIKSLALLSEKQENIFADHLRSIAILISFQIKPSNTGRGYVLRSLLRNIFWILQQKKDTCLLSKADLKSFFRIIASFHPFIKNEENTFVTEIIGEITKFNKLIEKGKILIKKMKTSGSLKDNDLIFLQETHGLPSDFICSIL